MENTQTIDKWKRIPKHVRVKNSIKEQILRLSDGDMIPPVRDLMKQFEVSQATLDRALLKLEEENLIFRKRGSGIYVNRKKKRIRNHLIGVIILNINDRFSSLLVKGIEEYFSDGDYRILLCRGHEEFEREVEIIRLLKERIDGLIVKPTTNNIYNPEYVQYFVNLERSKQFPFLVVDIHIPGIENNCIGFDNFNAFSNATQFVLEMRNFRSVYIGAMESFIGIERWQGFRQGLRNVHISEKSIEVINVSLSPFKMDIPPNIISNGKPAVFFVASPLILPELNKILQKKNIRIPEEAIIVSVVEEDYLDYTIFPIVALVKPSIELGRTAAGILQRIVSGKKVRIPKLDLRLEVPKEYDFLK